MEEITKRNTVITILTLDALAYVFQIACGATRSDSIEEFNFLGLN